MRITFTGDLLAYKSLIKKSRTKNGFDFTNVFKRVKNLFDSSDYVIGNLEMPLCNNKKGPFTKMDMLFNTPHEFARDAKECGFDMFTTANNHCMDFGIEGLVNTIDILDSYGIDHTGTFKSPNEPRFFIKSIKGIKLAFISYTYSTNPNVNGICINNDNSFHVNITRKQDVPIERSFIKQLLLRLYYRMPYSLQNKLHPLYPNHGYEDCIDANEVNSNLNKDYEEEMISIINEAKSVSDMLVFCLHSGGQFNSNIGNYTQHLVDIIGPMVNLLVVNHPHCVLGSTWQDGSLAVYSLGNFCFTPKEGYYIDGVYCDYGIVLNVDIDEVQHSISDISFTVIKSIKDDDGLSYVISIKDLYDELVSEKDKNVLIADNKAVIRRFLGHSLNCEIKKEYKYFI